MHEERGSCRTYLPVSRKVRKAALEAGLLEFRELGVGCIDEFRPMKTRKAGTIAAVRAAIAGALFRLRPCENGKKPAASYSRTSERRTTLGDGALDFRVRNGNGYDSPSMATGERDRSRLLPQPGGWGLKRTTARLPRPEGSRLSEVELS